MKLYHRQLNSVEALKREKLRLRYEQLQTKASDLNPIAEMGKRKKAKEAASSNFFGLAMSLFGAKSNAERAMKIAPYAVRLLGNRTKKVGEKGKSLLAKAVGEILTGYLIGKGVQLSVQVVTRLIREKRAKKKDEKVIKRIEKRIGAR